MTDHPITIEVTVLPSPYRPIEQLLPGWPEARQEVMKLLPDRLRFIRRTICSLEIDWYWLYLLADIAPIQAAAMVNCLISEVDAKVAESYSKEFMDALHDHLGSPITGRTVPLMNQLLEYEDELRRSQGKPTTMEIIKHYLGIEQCLLITTITKEK